MRVFLAGEMPAPVTSVLDAIPDVHYGPCQEVPEWDGAGQSWDCSLVAFPEDPDQLDALLEQLHVRLPRVPIGLIATREERPHALKLLRSRAVDRLISSEDLASELRAALLALGEHHQRLNQLYQALPAMDGNTIFLTGATGFLGGHFLRYLLRCSAGRVIALTRRAGNTPYNQRLAHLERLHPGRLVCVEGDVRLPGLCLSSEAQALLAEQSVEIWHLAAITRFEEILRDLIFQVNLEGTRNVVEFARRLPGVKHLHHVSTAYAAGNGYGEDAVPEGPLKRPTSFKNPYEESKHEAERCVSDANIPYTIYRPSIILGESVSGLCDGQTVYNVAKMIRLAKMVGVRHGIAHQDAANQTFRVEVDHDAAKNLIHVDDVVCRMLHIAARRPRTASYFNLSHPEPAPMTDLIAVIAALLDIPEYETVHNLDGAPLSAAEAVLQRISGVFRPYMLTSDALFKSELAHAASGGHPLAPMDRNRLQFLIQSFLEQHYPLDVAPQPALV